MNFCKMRGVLHLKIRCFSQDSNSFVAFKHTKLSRRNRIHKLVNLSVLTSDAKARLLPNYSDIDSTSALATPAREASCSIFLSKTLHNLLTAGCRSHAIAALIAGYKGRGRNTKNAVSMPQPNECHAEVERSTSDEPMQGHCGSTPAPSNCKRTLLDPSNLHRIASDEGESRIDKPH